MLERSWGERTFPTVWTGSASIVSAATTTLFAATILAGAGLIFTVEPMFAKMVLPRAGGSPAVWNTCVVFFQAAMLAGYAYAHLTTRWLTVPRQVALHVTLVLLAAVTLPIAVPAGWTPPADSTPIPWLLLTLAAGLGAPFLMLSATAPLLQRWFAATDHPSARDPYHLYAASNVGSLVALLSYPLVVERVWTLGEQSGAWTAVYAVFGALLVACAVLVLRYAPSHGTQRAREAAVDGDDAITWRQRGRWLLLSLVPSSLLLGVTTYLSTDIASVPLLWTVPLALYLLTFALAFSRRPLIPRRAIERATPLLITALIVPMAAGANFSLLMIPAHLLAFFGCALSLHTALAHSRPSANHLTEFYLWIAAGGVIGGLFNTLVAPALFDSVVEYAAGLAAACLLQPAASAADRRIDRGDIVLPAAIASCAVAATWAARVRVVEMPGFLIVLAVLAIVAFSFSRRPIRFGLAIAAMLVVAHVFPATPERLLAADRTFFGVLKVRENETVTRHELMHGRILHGRQELTAGMRAEPLSYYHRSGPVGQMMTALSDRLQSARIGAVGLGAGSLAAYVTPGQRWTFFEIDPAVARIARDPAYFTYLETCGSQCSIVLGDARLSLADTSARYDLLVLDAFSSDAIPVHLLTREALRVYTARLAPHGVMAFHISNQHMRLRPVLTALANDLDLAALVQLDAPSAEVRATGHFASEWFLMAREAADFGRMQADARWELPRPAGASVWTDDFSDVLSVMKNPWR